MTKEFIEELIEDLYNAKDQVSEDFKEGVQITIDLLDNLLLEGALYLDEE